MAELRMNELAKELLQRSRDGKVPWEEKPRGRRSDQDAYQVVFPDGALILSREGLGPTEFIEGVGEVWTRFEYQLALLGDTGRIIDSLTPKPEEPMSQTLAEIFDLAEGYVRETGISKALDFLKSR
jgi:hypothetical protein